jgi:Lamin Tail Domain
LDPSCPIFGCGRIDHALLNRDVRCVATGVLAGVSSTERVLLHEDKGTIVKKISTIFGVAAAACAFAAMAVTPASAAALPTVRIARVVFNPSGSDTHANHQLNREYVELRNTGRHPVTLTGWTLRDTSRHVYTFERFTLRAGALVTVHTGTGTDTAKNVYQDRGWYVWNNTHDTATVRTGAGRTVTTCHWSRGGSGATDC